MVSLIIFIFFFFYGIGLGCNLVVLNLLDNITSGYIIIECGRIICCTELVKLFYF